MEPSEHNLREIEMLSQRGRTLSIVDLLNANTLSVPMASHLLCMMADGASFLTSARPGNAGKTTLMACMLMFMPPDGHIETISEPSVISRSSSRAHQGKVCYLCHEIGNGPWYGYLWGRDVGAYFQLLDENRTLAACIHADTLDEMRGVLLSDDLNVAETDFRQLDFVLFMHLEHHDGEYRRRVSTFLEATDEPSRQDEGYRPLFTWDRDSDTFRQNGDSVRLQALAKARGRTPDQSQSRLSACESFLRRLVDTGLNDYRSVYAEIARFHEEELV